MSGNSSRRREKENDDEKELSEEDDVKGEYELQDINDRIKSSRGSRFNLIINELRLEPFRRFSRESVVNGIRGLSKGFVIHPDNRYAYVNQKFQTVRVLF